MRLCRWQPRKSLSLPEGDYELLASTPDGRLVQGTARVRVRATPEERTVHWRPVATGSIAGRMFDRMGRPLAGEQLQFWHESTCDDRERLAARRLHVAVRTDREGRFRASGLPPGRWFVTPDRGLRHASVPVDVVVGAQSTVELR